MPELPEVQTTVEGINRYAKGLSIKDVWTNYGGVYHIGKDHIKDVEFFAKFKKQIVGKKIVGAKRRAKNVLIELSDESIILVHLKMTGHLLYGEYKKIRSTKSEIRIEEWIPAKKGTALDDPFNRFIRLIFKLSNGKYLALSDMRRFAKVTHIEKDGIESSKHLERLGPEPLDRNFNVKNFEERLLQKPVGKVKQVLMDQSIIAGIGNIYSDEILWRAGIHPERLIKDIRGKEFKLMYDAMRRLLQKGIDLGGDSMSDYRNIMGERGRFQDEHKAYRRTGEKCQKPRCTGIIVRKIVGGRSAHFCPKHQK